MTPAAKRGAVDCLVSEHRLSRTKACKIVGLSRSVYYKPRVDWVQKDGPIIEALIGVVAKRARWGFWTCFHHLRNGGSRWNHKRAHRVYCDMRLNLQRRTKKRLITRERQPLLASAELNHVWILDFMRDTMDDGRPFRTLNVIDEGQPGSAADRVWNIGPIRPAGAGPWRPYLRESFKKSQGT